MKKFAAIALATFLLFGLVGNSYGKENLPDGEWKNKFENGKRPKIGLALCGGGVLGFAHVGIIKLIDSLNIPIDYVAGTSMGGIVGALYSMGYTAEEMEKLGVAIDWEEIFSDAPRREMLPFIEKQKSGKYQIVLDLNGFTPKFPSGLIEGQKIQNLFLDITYPFEGRNDFDQLPIPFRCVAADLITGNEVVLRKGSLSKALRSTMSIPSVFTPVEYGDSLLIDGGVLNNFPVDVVRSMGADIVIGLNLNFGKRYKKDLKDIFSVLDRTADLPRNPRLEKNKKGTDIYIESNVRNYSVMDFSDENIMDIVDIGERAGNLNKELLIELRDSLKRYGIIGEVAEESSNKYNVYKQTYENYKKNPPVIKGINIEGNKVLDFSFIYANLGIRPGEEFITKNIKEKIDALYSLGYFKKISYEVREEEEGFVKLIISVEERSLRKLHAGFRYDDFHKIVAIFGIETTSLLFDGNRMEAQYQFGGIRKFDLKISYPSRSMDFPVYPFVSVHYKSVPTDLYFKEDKVAEYKDRSLTLRGGLGINLSKYWVLEGSFDYEYMDIKPIISSNNFANLIPTWKDNIARIKVDLEYDILDDVLLPRHGAKFSSFYEYSGEALGTDVLYNRYYADLKLYKTFGKYHTIGLRGAVMHSWDNVPIYKRFHIGGPESFVGINFDQGIGSRWDIFRFTYRYEYKRDIFFKAVFNTAFDYNLGTLSNPTYGRPLLGYGIGLKFTSILGLFEIMYARGDANIRNPGTKQSQLYFTAGMKF